ncbi:FAD-binding oxidoreductase [Acuticoccus yangtzensis]|uniref:FAD-binding oxidoreductase n=1 Tax=Acuticoccus yangtzensis TaxID=1443441 RepID=UPI000949A603|nr:FAD-binding oxidoreductase [Acuticoccus yangtzensis]
MTFHSRLTALLGSANVLVDHDAQSYLTDWRKLRTGRALAVARPGTTEEVAALVRLCAAEGVPIVPQGGNTGQVAAATPDESATALVVSLERMNRVREIDVANDTITVEAGCILAAVQDAAREAGRLFPLSLGAEGSCQIGGNLSTNAGGIKVLRYGNARELTLGLEVVTAEGAIWNGLAGLRKDNTGYDLRDLYIGAEGTLGIITAATLKLYPLPAAEHTAFLALRTLPDASAVLAAARAALGDALVAFEVMSGPALALVAARFPEQRLPLTDIADDVAWFALVETAGAAEDDERLMATLAEAMEEGRVVDAAVAGSDAQRAAMWRLRESITLAISETGPCIKHDVSLPRSRMDSFVAASDADLAMLYPGARLIVFGHLGDGNLHYNVLGPEGASRADVAAMSPAVQRMVHDRVVAAGGSISAEQGIGWARIDDLRRYKDPVALDLMHRVKAALDPRGIMNPGKVLAPETAPQPVPDPVP